MKRDNLGKRIGMSLFGVIICAISVGIFKIAALGVDPFQSFMAGLDAIVPISFGTLYVITNAVMLLFALVFDRHYIGIATFINLFLLGYITQFTYEFLQTVIVDPSIVVRIICLIVGVVIICFGSAFYMTADLGVSSHHFDDESRGFSFRFDAPLDMRMNKKADITAADVVNGYSEQQLADLLFLYGELRQSRRLAGAIVKARAARPILTTTQLVETVSPLLPRERERKEVTKVFQALRIEVNHEMEALSEMLSAAIQLLTPGGRLSVITYHSLEDRIVKNMMKAGNVTGTVTQDFFGRTQSPLSPLSNKVITPDEKELLANPRSRSAKLRVAVKN